MRRLAAISALVLMLLCAPVWAQRRGGSVGFHSEFAPRGGVFHGSFPHSGITIRTFPPPFRHFHRNFGFFRPWFGYGYPVYYSGYYDPLLWGSASSYYAYDNSNAYGAYYDQTQQLQRQINRLEDEVDRLHDEQYAQPATPPPAATPPFPAKPEPASLTVLIFKDQHREEVKNYAVVGRTVWIFSEQRARKIPLDQLDIPATQQANDERGLDFRIPG
jgi:hypothetical protein